MIWRMTTKGLAAALLVYGALCLIGAPEAGADSKRWSQGYFPDLPVLDQNGRELRFYDDVIKDRIVVVSFFYTRCKSICPVATARLATLADELGDKLGRDIFFVSLSVDPEHDKPDVLKGYAETFHRGPGWLFLTGKLEDMRAINAKFGERMLSLSGHRNEVVLGNDRTGEWARDSAFGDLERLSFNVQSMDPDWRPPLAGHNSATTVSKSYELNGPPGQALFKKLCSSCHAFKVGDRVGPDLYGITSRRTREWLGRFIKSPEAMRSSEDPIALALMRQFPHVRMPDLDLTEVDVEDLISYLDQRTALLVRQAAEYEEMMHGEHDAHAPDDHSSQE